MSNHYHRQLKTQLYPVGFTRPFLSPIPPASAHSQLISNRICSLAPLSYMSHTTSRNSYHHHHHHHHWAAVVPRGAGSTQDSYICLFRRAKFSISTIIINVYWGVVCNHHLCTCGVHPSSNTSSTLFRQTH